MTLSSLLPWNIGAAEAGVPGAADADPEASLARGAALMAAGKADEARPFLRAATHHATSRAQLVELTRKAAALDPDFKALVAGGDAARDDGRWAEGERHYAQALALYPAHAGYLVQYGHCLKEQEKFAEAEIAYRSALALGAPHDDVGRHLAFVSHRQGYDDWRPPAMEPSETAMDAPPTRSDVDLVHRLLTGEPADILTALDILRRAQTVREVFTLVIDQPRFVAANRGLLGLIADGSLPLQT